MIWLPTWTYLLTRERIAGPTEAELDVSQGDIEVLTSLTIRGSSTASLPLVRWRSDLATDEVFELVGDYNGNGVVDAADYTIWQNERYSTGPGYDADGDEDSDVDDDDYLLWNNYFGNTLTLQEFIV